MKRLKKQDGLEGYLCYSFIKSYSQEILTKVYLNFILKRKIKFPRQKTSNC